VILHPEAPSWLPDRVGRRDVYRALSRDSS
jgi:hypothetical protein